MMDCTDRHFRWIMRQISRRALLYTEMIPVQTLIHGDREHFLGFDPIEHPVAAQLGGDDPKQLALCAKIVEDFGYDEVNLNVGCPSERVQAGRFGACLMAAPQQVAEAVAAMRHAVSIPVTVKHRIGIDECDAYEDMARFVAIVAEAGCDRFSVHARKAWLSGLSPKQNRTVPPLRHGDVHRLKREFSHLVIEINGGIQTMDAARWHLVHVDAVMVGRSIYEDPYRFAAVDACLFGNHHEPPSRVELVERVAAYVRSGRARGVPLSRLSRHLMGIFAGQPGARAFRRRLSSNAAREGTRADLFLEALADLGRAYQRLAG